MDFPVRFQVCGGNEPLQMQVGEQHELRVPHPPLAHPIISRASHGLSGNLLREDALLQIPCPLRLVAARVDDFV